MAIDSRGAKSKTKIRRTSAPSVPNVGPLLASPGSREGDDLHSTCRYVPRAAVMCRYLPCGPESRVTRSVGILDVPRRAFYRKQFALDAAATS